MADSLHAALRATIAADLRTVRALRSPGMRALALVPIAALLLLAAPVVFELRNVSALGMTWSWGASLFQIVAGIALIGAALREAVPGRRWSTPVVVSLLVLPLTLIVVVTFASWQRDPVVVDLDWRIVAGACVAGLLTSALPAIAGAAVLATRAFPTRPTVVGALAGLGAGLMADAGWRLFCHYSEPTHVLATHLTGVMLASIVGALLLRAMTIRRS